MHLRLGWRFVCEGASSGATVRATEFVSLGLHRTLVAATLPAGERHPAIVGIANPHPLSAAGAAVQQAVVLHPVDGQAATDRLAMTEPEGGRCSCNDPRERTG